MENSKIEWCDATFNPWIGCTKVSAGCKHCYAELQMDKRYKRVVWGKGNPRQLTSESNWRKPRQWNKDAAAKGIRYRVFCASLADVFDAEVPDEWRERLFTLILDTPHLDWLLLTKRPENVVPFMETACHPGTCHEMFDGELPPNVWIGTSVENQEAADERIPHLLQIPAVVRFLSCEPLLGPVDLSGRTVESVWIDPDYAEADHLLGEIVAEEGWGIHWLITGGESGPGARPMNPDWARGLRDQCQKAGVKFLFKQWGEYVPQKQLNGGDYGTNGITPFPEQSNLWVWRVGKHRAGRLLDGREWNEFPTPHPVP